MIKSCVTGNSISRLFAGTNKSQFVLNCWQVHSFSIKVNWRLNSSTHLTSHSNAPSLKIINFRMFAKKRLSSNNKRRAGERGSRLTFWTRHLKMKLLSITTQNRWGIYFRIYIYINQRQLTIEFNITRLFNLIFISLFFQLFSCLFSRSSGLRLGKAFSLPTFNDCLLQFMRSLVAINILILVFIHWFFFVSSQRDFFVYFEQLNELHFCADESGMFICQCGLLDLLRNKSN